MNTDSALTVHHVIGASRLIGRAFQIRTGVLRLRGILISTRAKRENFLLAKGHRFLAPCGGSLTSVRCAVERLSRLVRSGPRRIRELSRLRRLAKQGVGRLSHTVRLGRTRRRRQLARFLLANSKQQLVRRVHTLIRRVLTIRRRLLRRHDSTTARTTHMTSLVSLKKALLIVNVYLFTLKNVAHRIVTPVRQITGALTSSSSGLTKTIRSRRTDTRRRTITIRRAAAAVSRLGTSSRRSSRRTSISTVTTQRMVALTGANARIIRRALDSVRDVHRGISTVITRVTRLRSRTRRVTNVASIINGLTGRAGVLTLGTTMRTIQTNSRNQNFSIITDRVQGLTSRDGKSTSGVGSLLTDVRATITGAITATSSKQRAIRRKSGVIGSATTAFVRIASTVNRIMADDSRVSLGTERRITTVRRIISTVAALGRRTIHGTDNVDRTHTDTRSLGRTIRRLRTII